MTERLSSPGGSGGGGENGRPRLWASSEAKQAGVDLGLNPQEAQQFLSLVDSMQIVGQDLSSQINPGTPRSRLLVRAETLGTVLSLELRSPWERFLPTMEGSFPGISGRIQIFEVITQPSGPTLIMAAERERRSCCCLPLDPNKTSQVAAALRRVLTAPKIEVCIGEYRDNAPFRFQHFVRPTFIIPEISSSILNQKALAQKIIAPALTEYLQVPVEIVQEATRRFLCRYLLGSRHYYCGLLPLEQSQKPGQPLRVRLIEEREHYRRDPELQFTPNESDSWSLTGLSWQVPVDSPRYSQAFWARVDLRQPKTPSLGIIFKAPQSQETQVLVAKRVGETLVLSSPLAEVLKENLTVGIGQNGKVNAINGQSWQPDRKLIGDIQWAFERRGKDGSRIRVGQYTWPLILLDAPLSGKTWGVSLEPDFEELNPQTLLYQFLLGEGIPFGLTVISPNLLASLSD